MMIKNRRLDIFFRLLCAVTIAVAAGTGTAVAQSPGPKTVADFLLLVPERYMVGYDLRFREEMLRGEHRGVVIDIPNGYISYDASDNPSGFEFAVFWRFYGSTCPTRTHRKKGPGAGPVGSKTLPAIGRPPR